MPEIAWDIQRIEAQAKRWQEMASVLPNDSDRVAWLIEQISYLCASHMQLQQLCRVHSDAGRNRVTLLSRAEHLSSCNPWGWLRHGCPLSHFLCSTT